MATKIAYVDPQPWIATTYTGLPLYPEGRSRKPLRFTSREECQEAISARRVGARYRPLHCPRDGRTHKEAVAEIVSRVQQGRKGA